MSENTLRDPALALTPSAVVSTLLSAVGITATGKLDAALAGTVPWFCWHGKTPGDDAGRFWIPALFPSRRLPEALRELAGKRRAAGKPSDDESCREAMRDFHAGLGKRFVGKCPFAFVEIDHLPRADQQARYAALAAATGLRWALMVFSGGKSVHAYLAFTVPLDADDPLRLEIQRLLVVALEGDTRITDPGRLMRLPGWSGRERKQPVVHFEPDARFDAADVRDRLRDYVTALGIADVEVAFRTLEVAEALGVEAKHYAEAGDTEAAEELRAHAAVLRATRADPAAADVTLARAMLGTGAKAAAVAGATPRVSASGSASTVYLSDAEMAAYAGLARLTSVHPPCCADNPKLKGTVLSEPGSPWGPVVWCHKHDTRFVVGFGREGDAEVADLDVDDLVGTAATDEPEPEEFEESDLSEADARVLELERARWAPYVSEWIAADDRLATLLDDDKEPDDGSTSVPGDFVPRRLKESSRSLRWTKSGEDELCPSEPDPDFEARVPEALERWVALGNVGTWCRRGPYNHTSKDTHEARETRLPCCSYRCTSCGPWKLSALRAAAWVVVRRRTSTGTWKALRVVVPAHDGTALKALRRWAAEDSDARFHVGFALNPEEVGLLVAWDTSGAAPAPSGAFRRHLTRLGSVEVAGPVHGAVDALADGIELGSWEEGRAEIVRGCAELVSAVATLHKRVLGRSGAKGKSATDGFSVRTYTTGDELRRAVSDRAVAPVVVGEVEPGVRNHTSGCTWAVADTPVRPFLEALRDEGFFRPLRHRRAADDGDGWFEVSLASK